MAKKSKSTDLKFILTRIFAAPRALVFAAWTQPKHLKQWSAPLGFTVPVSEGELRPGGKWRACMESPQTGELWLGGIYRQVVPDTLLVFTHAWDDNDGAPPHETLVTVRFEDHPLGTKLTLEQSGFTSRESCDGHNGGWSESLDRLVAHLANVKDNESSPTAKRKSGGLGRTRTARGSG